MHQSRDLLGAHVSTQGGVQNAWARGKAIGATAIQVFTKTPSQWREPALTEESRTAFRRECDRSEIASIVAHDSYLINLASPDPALADRFPPSSPIPAISSTIAKRGCCATPRRTLAASRRFPAK
jgi:hypothetical protein